MNIHLPAILGFTRYQGFDPSPYHDTPNDPGFRTNGGASAEVFAASFAAGELSCKRWDAKAAKGPQ